jgi:hypothetical protein
MRVRTWGAILSIAVISAVGCGKQEPAAPSDASAPSGASARAPSAQNATWEVEGTMGDACQCAVFCPCEFGSHPTQDNCDDAGILSITKGHYKDVDLSGQKVVVVSASPSGERLVDAVGKLTFARIYVPKDATDEQVDALAQIVRNVFGTFVGKTPRISPDEKVVRTDMAITVDSTRYAATIPGVLDVEMKPVIGGDGRTPIVVHNNAFTAMGFGDVAVWQSQKYTYTAEGRKWNYSGRSASVRSFSLKG